MGESDWLSIDFGVIIITLDLLSIILIVSTIYQI